MKYTFLSPLFIAFSVKFPVINGFPLYIVMEIIQNMRLCIKEINVIPHKRSMAITPSMFFAFYMMINWWNMFNARVIGKNKSVFDGLTKNGKFTGIIAFVLIATILIVQFGGKVFQTEPLSFSTWISLILITAPVMVFKEIYFQLFGKKRR